MKTLKTTEPSEKATSKGSLLLNTHLTKMSNHDESCRYPDEKCFKVVAKTPYLVTTVMTGMAAVGINGQSSLQLKVIIYLLTGYPVRTENYCLTKISMREKRSISRVFSLFIVPSPFFVHCPYKGRINRAESILTGLKPY